MSIELMLSLLNKGNTGNDILSILDVIIDQQVDNKAMECDVF